MGDVTLGEVAQALRMDVNLVRDILTEKHGIKVDKAAMDTVFGTARKMGYDFKKLKLGKRMNLREEVLTDVITQIENNPKWKRKEIIEYLKKSCEMIARVHNRTFQEEFSKDKK
jgi:hypothetical protein